MKKAGRPLSFDRQQALEKAKLVFWKSGYETTSITDLTQAMGINAPSLYAAFGDKKRLFIEVVNLYAFGDNSGEDFINKAATAYDAAHLLLTASLNIFSDENTPPGCLMASSTATGSDGSLEVRQYVSGIRTAMRAALKSRIDRDIEENKLPPSLDSAALANYIFAIIQGMSVLARDGLNRQDLQNIAQVALSSWPQTTQVRAE